MVRFIAVLLGLVLAVGIPFASMAEGKARARREAEMAAAVRSVLRHTTDPAAVAELLQKSGTRLLGFQETTVTFVYDGERVVPAQSATRTLTAGAAPAVSVKAAGGSTITPLAGEKADLTLTLWLYEWRNWDGTYTEQAAISGYWSATEYSWLDDPADVIDVRWTVGDLVYASSTPFDGVKRDQHTNGIASYTVNDQVKSWDLFVNFKPVSFSVYGKWTNIFANYTQAW